ncbi:MAG: hypothetical protein QOD61_1455 [Solirubrobacteraceae bacterium]|jgi:predicted nucleic acid-binding protein|nr:hypothetical protein [Solirubrobacteraceae bacterium]MEA2355326.1 hypothetical protein [Solirubrobacteraceae bacterium]
MPLILLDKSAWVRGGPELVNYGELWLCAITRMEILYGARPSPKQAEPRSERAPPGRRPAVVPDPSRT